MPHQRTILLTGTTGGLGAKVLSDLLTTHRIPGANIIATSRRESSRAHFEALGVQFRVADFNDPAGLEEAFQGVRRGGGQQPIDDLLFVSGTSSDHVQRTQAHGNVIEAAKKAGVRRTWYVSLAFGGYGDGSTIGFQKAHYATEEMLRGSGIDFISLRSGIYSDAFPLFLNWYPSDGSKVTLPEISPGAASARVAYASRAELGEATATLLARGLGAFAGVEARARAERGIVLLTGPEAVSVVELAEAIGRGLGEGMEVEYVAPAARWVEMCGERDEGGKGKEFFEKVTLPFLEGVARGDAETVDPALEVILGRRPESGTETVERLLKEDKGFTWHQNYVVDFAKRY